jgi:hypothetical protein
MGRRTLQTLAVLAASLFIPMAPAAAEATACEVTLDADHYYFDDHPVDVWGTAQGCNGQTLIVVAWSSSGTSMQVGEVVIDGDEAYRLSLSTLPPSWNHYTLRAGVPNVSVTAPVNVRRPNPPTVTNSSPKPVGEATYAWGTCDALDGPVGVRVEFLVGPESWSLSGLGTTNASGGYVVPLTYGSDVPGERHYRLSCVYPEGRAHSYGWLYRYGEPTYTSAPTRTRLHDSHSATGQLRFAEVVEVRTEALTPSGWQRSSSGWSRGGGDFSAPLTYGVNQVGPTTYRVALRLSDGRWVRAKQFTVVREANPLSRGASIHTATVADSSRWGGFFHGAPVGRDSNVWGSFRDVTAPLQVWTEVNPGDGVFRTSQVRTTDASGGYVVPITYGKDRAGSINLRVAARYPDGQVVRSESVVFRRY